MSNESTKKLKNLTKDGRVKDAPSLDASTASTLASQISATLNGKRVAWKNWLQAFLVMLEEFGSTQRIIRTNKTIAL